MSPNPAGGPPPGLIIAAPASGSGKTLVTLGLIRAWSRRGRRVAGAKIGPDYIDPGFHRLAGAVAVRNLDGWAMRRSTFEAAVADLSDAGDLIVCEGVMGLFDGAPSPPSPPAKPAKTSDPNLGTPNSLWPGNGSTADCAASTGWPVLLIIDASGQAATAAAVVHGCATARADVTIAGALFNRVGGPRHAEALSEGMRRYAPDIPLLGCLPRNNGVDLPSRHLGLVQAGELAEAEDVAEAAADWITHHLDLDVLAAAARPGRATEPVSRPVRAEPPIAPLGQRMAVARDDAFAFLYDGVTEGWRRAGAEITFFSPLADEAPAAQADAVILPGGYPELHAGTLAANRLFLDGLRRAARDGVEVYGECGGFMTLGCGLIDGNGTRHPMAGLLPLETRFDAPKLTLGYRQLTLAADTPLGSAGDRFRGHEFHYAQIVAQQTGGEPLFDAADAVGRPLTPMGLRQGNVCGSFAHLIDRF